jgi:hypothetical protein
MEIVGQHMGHVEAVQQVTIITPHVEQMIHGVVYEAMDEVQIVVLYQIHVYTRIDGRRIIIDYVACNVDEARRPEMFDVREMTDLE